MRRHIDSQISVLTNQRGRRQTRRTVADVFRLIRQTLGVCRKIDVVQRAGFALIAQTGRNDPAIKIKHLRVPQHGHGLLLLFDDREQTPVIGRAHHDFAVRQKLGRIRTGRPPDHVVFDRCQFIKRLLLAFFGLQHVIDVFFCHAIAQQRPFDVVDRTLFKRALAGIGFGVENSTDRCGRCIANHIRAVAKGRGINDLRDEAVADQQIAKVILGGCPVGRRGQHFVRVDFHRQTFVTQTQRVRRNDVDHIPCHIARFVHRAQF